MECSDLTELVVDRLTLAGQAGQPVRDLDLDLHLAACDACREEAERIERAWQALGNDAEIPVTREFRELTLALLDDEMRRGRIRDFAPRARWPRLYALAAALLLACATGFLVARSGAFSAYGSPVRSAAVSPGKMLEGNPRLANVSYRSEADGKIEVGFDVTARQTVTGRPNDPEMAKLLAYLLARNSETAGEKSRTIELVSEHYRTGMPASPAIVGALTATLKKDPNPGVRKKAADALAGFATTPEIRAAFLDALRSDRNPAVRLTAIEALAASAKEAPDLRTIESLREKAQDPTENGFVRAKAASALKNF